MRGYMLGAGLALAGWAGTAAAQGMEWVYTSWTPVPGGPPSISLDYGVAYTDMVQFSLNCVSGSVGAMVDMDFFSPIGSQRDNSPTTVTLRSPGGGAVPVPARIFDYSDSSGHTGARATLALDHPVFASLQQRAGLTFQIAGQQVIALPVDQARADLAQFVTACSATAPGAGGGAAAPMPPRPADPPAAYSCDSYAGARSVAGDVPQQVTFQNAAPDARVLFWIDYAGHPTQIAIVEPGLWVTIDSYLTHPWLITDMTGLCREVMQPQPGQDRYEIGN